MNPLIRNALVLAIIFLSTDACSQETMKLDAYGGNKKIKGKETGFFHLEEKDERQYLITPEGNAYRALGINHFHMMTSTDYDQAVQNIKEWGFNAGCYQGPRWMWERYPYTQGINLVPVCSWMPDNQFGFRDVFDPLYLAEMEAHIKKIVQPQKENRLLIGYFWTDIPVWERQRDEQGWISFYKGLPKDSPGGQFWTRWKASHPEKAEEAFIALIARQLYARGYEYLRKYDSNHLVFGDRYFEEDIPDIVVREALLYIDAIAIQPTSREFNHEFFDRLYSAYKKPIYIADHVSSWATEEHPVTMGQAAKDPESYMDYYERYVTTAFSQAYLIGFNKCQYQDQIVRGGMLKQGLLKLDGTPYLETIPGITRANQKALSKAYGDTKR